MISHRIWSLTERVTQHFKIIRFWWMAGDS